MFCLQRKHLILWVILNIVFYGEGLLAPRPAPKLGDHPSSAVRGCLFNLFTATLHIGGRSSIRNPRTRHALVTGTHIHGSKCLTNMQINIIVTKYNSSVLEFVIRQNILKVKVIVSLFAHKFVRVNLEFGFAKSIYLLTESCLTQVYERGM